VLIGRQEAADLIPPMAFDRGLQGSVQGIDRALVVPVMPLI
jgi:hypothetical protein